MCVKAGKVGIGTESPGYELDVRGTINTTYLRVEATGTGLYVAGTAMIGSNLAVGGMPNMNYRIYTPGDVKIGGKLYTDYIQGINSNLDFTLMPPTASKMVQVGYGGTPRNFAVWGDTSLYGNLNVDGKIYGWNVPSFTLTAIPHNGNFGGLNGMYQWIQQNGCTGYHVCDSKEIEILIELGYSTSEGCWVNPTFLGWDDACRDWVDGGNTHGTYWQPASLSNVLNYMDICSIARKVCCCK
jgi:hypothetical protein